MNTEEERASLGRTVYTATRRAQPERTRLPVLLTDGCRKCVSC